MKFKLLLLSFLLSATFGWGQVSLTLDNFGAAAQNPMSRTGWTTVAPAGSPWELRTTGASSGYSWTNPAVSSSGSANAFTNLGNGTAIKSLTYDNSVSTVSYTGIAVRFGGLRSGTVPNVDVSYSTDGTVYTSAGTIALSTTWTAHTVALPVGAEGVSNLRIRLSVVANNNATNFLRIDDFHVIGTLSCTPSANPSGVISGVTPACGSTSLSFSGTAIAPEVYYWQTSATGTSTANNASGNLPVSTSGNYYVRTYNGTCWSASSVGPYAVTINTPVNIGTQPTNQTVTAPTTANFTVAATGTGLTYQWEVSTDGGGIWNNVSTGTGGTTNSYTTPATVIGMNGYMYRVIVSGTAPCTSVTSNAVTLTVNAPSPEINLQGNSVNITDGDSSPVAADHTDFGNAVVGSTTVIRTFTIQNTGGAALTLAGASPYVTISGTNAADFAITAIPSNNIAAAGSTTFQVTFTPSATGVRSATLTINNNDSDEGVYDFAIQGTGTASNLSDLVLVAGSSPVTISSTVNNNAPLTSGTGVQVLQFRLRDGGAALSDADNLPTIMTAFTIAQVSNTVSTWSDAINTIELFDGTTRIAAGTVTATQIQFTGLNISTPDNTEKTLSLRMSLKCPLGPDAFDNERFGFSISNANTTFSAAGSSKTTFTAVANAAGTNTINVVATQLSFTSQPTTTGVNSGMSNVVVTAADSCGNTDLDFVAAVTLTSTGTMTGAPLSVNAVGGVATYVGIVHTVVGTNFTLSASAIGLTPETSIMFDIVAITNLQRGDLAILAVNVNTGAPSGTDQLAFVCFEDILPGTTIYLTDNGYERQFADEWGGTEGVIRITRTGTTLPKGTVIVIQSTTANVTSGTHYDIYTCGVADANWTKGVVAGGSGFNLNPDDDVWIMQGGTWTNDASHHSTYDGTVLYGWTESGWDAAPGGGAQSTFWSTIYPGLECYNTVAPTGAGFVKFNDPINPDFSTITNGRFDWIALINNTANWDAYADAATYNSGGYDYKGNTACPAMTIAGSTYVNGKWTGKSDTNWFNCGNWDTLVVPDETVDVQVVDNAFDRQAIVDATAPFASYYGNIAKAKSLTITGEKVEVTANTNNKLEVHGNLLIDAPAGALDMDDSNAGTADGQLYLYGNWTNNMGNAAFAEGNGTVYFTGSVPQVISNVTPTGTEQFYDVILNNSFDTSVSNDLFLNGNLTINATKTLTVATNDYVLVDNNITNNGTFNINNSGSLVQVKDAGLNTGNILMQRNVSVGPLDYVYWSAPVSSAAQAPSFPVTSVSPGSPSGYIYKWDPVFANSNSTQGNWVSANENMVLGKGYILRGRTDSAPITANFTGKANNGVVSIGIARGSYQGAPYDAEPANANNILTNKEDDNWNLVGNPYPSALKVLDFLTDPANTNIDGFVNIWTHGTLPVSTTDPFYQDFVYNYTPGDYITYNGVGTTAGPAGFNGFIAAGQSFFVSMIDGPQDISYATTVSFRNAMRRDNVTNIPHNNSQFYRNAAGGEQGRLWLDIVSGNNVTSRTLVGYVPEATMQRDRLFDAITKVENYQTLYTVLNDETFNIQGRSLPFDDNDKVAVGFYAAADGNYTIALGAIDGFFANASIGIYLEDKQLNIIHDLRENPYQFVSAVGRFDDRFVLRYNNQTLSNDNFEVAQNNVIIYADENINISSSLEKIKDVVVYDVLGRLITEKKNVNGNTTILANVRPTQSTLIVKVTLENGQNVTKKVVH
jgi:hypothetical protein